MNPILRPPRHAPDSRTRPDLPALAPEMPPGWVTPLVARHLAATGPDPILTDPMSTDLVHQLGLTSIQDWFFATAQVAIAVRTTLLDTAIRDLARVYPDLCVITLGVGLCTRHARLADLGLDWVEVDLPLVAHLRTTLLPPVPGRIIIADTALGADWRARVPAGRHLVFVLEGITAHLTGDQVRHLLVGLADHFPDSDLLVDTIAAPLDLRDHAMPAGPVGVIRAGFLGQARHGHPPGAWHPRLRRERTWHLMDHHRSAWPLPMRVLRHLPSVRSQATLTHLRISTALPARRTPTGTWLRPAPDPTAVN